MSTKTGDEDGRRLDDEYEHGGTEPLVAVVVATGTEGYECTIYPADADGLDLMTRWITADEGAFVTLADAR